MSLDKELWNLIDEDLGTITEFRIEYLSPINSSTHSQVHFKSNGIDKIIASNDENFKFLIQCAYYCNELINPLKRYKHDF
jgi:hypothetical protein